MLSNWDSGLASAVLRDVSPLSNTKESRWCENSGHHCQISLYIVTFLASLPDS